MIQINLFGGPGTGKSTNAAGLFCLMKRKYYNCEIITEYAKELVYEGRFDMLKKQDVLLKEQNKRQDRLRRTVDFSITDSPLLMATTYIPPDFSSKKFADATAMKEEIITKFNSYNNMNFFLTRIKKYVPIGRTQTESEAKDKDKQILDLLNEQKVEYHTVVAGQYCPESILEIIEAAIEKDLAA